MIRKLVLGFVAAATISAAAFTPTAASAKMWGNKGWGWGGYHHHFGFGGVVVGPAYDSCYAVTPSGRLVNICY
jgi:hypothetical protein